MTFRPLLPIALSLAFALFSAHAAEPVQDFATAKAAAVADEASLDAPAKAALEATQRKLIDAGSAACATAKPELSPFVIVMELGADGRIAKTWRQGDSLLSICMEHALRDKTLIAPPRAPFYSLIEISFTK
jgi:hypothetical protein